jgi:hypothetical protein
MTIALTKVNYGRYLGATLRSPAGADRSKGIAPFHFPQTAEVTSPLRNAQPSHHFLLFLSIFGCEIGIPFRGYIGLLGPNFSIALVHIQS